MPWLAAGTEFRHASQPTYLSLSSTSRTLRRALAATEFRTPDWRSGDDGALGGELVQVPHQAAAAELL